MPVCTSIRVFVVFAEPERTAFVEIARIHPFAAASQRTSFSSKMPEVLSFQRLLSHIPKMSPSRPCLAPKLHYV